MRSALICVFLALVVQRKGICADNEEFKPTPIPLSDWPRDKHENAGTLHEIIKTEAPATVAAVPAHYWEDALRHSVYLTLVRDKIDQLIAKGDYISPDSKPDSEIAKDIDDHDLWDKIKTASFDRLKEEPIPPADVTILAKGRLFEDKEGYRFVEDGLSRSNCSTNDCSKGVKAYWSVKRMRQGESSPGKYHYELTFSVTSQTNRKVRKPYENPVRTFTIKENSPIERPQARHHDKSHRHGDRPQRAIWFHKNINPSYSHQNRHSYSKSLDRIFSSLFSDEESYEEPPYRQYRQKTYVPPTYPQHAKVGHADERDPYHQKKLMPYPAIKAQPYKYAQPPIQPPPLAYVQHPPYANVDLIGNIPYVHQHIDNRYVPSNIIKTTRPAVLPTPNTNYPLLKESTIEVPIKTKLNASDYTTKEPDVITPPHKVYNAKPQPMKISYFPDHIRPPVYNAPPGVFVTMDKKPFKPMPPLKYAHPHKPQKTIPPDFRPSPQVLDTQFSEEDSSGDSAFRPITMNFTEDYDGKGPDIVKKNHRKTSATKKPAKKHENIKSHRLTTVTPDIITVQSISEPEEDQSMEWANILGAFTKTTPMASHKERGSTERNERITTTTPLSVSIPAETEEEDDSDEEEISITSTSTTTTTTTAKPKKRTRPPPKFSKTDKIKKHKRVTSTTTTTIKPLRKYPTKKPSEDLTPQASSAATSGTNNVWETKTHRAPVAMTTSTTAQPTTTTALTTTTTTSTTSISSTTVDTEQPVATTQPKSKNRFRQSTLMHKGTSVNHDKWSSSLEKNRTNSVTSNKFPRRKASKFTGYIPLSTPRSPEVERDKEDHRDHAYNNYYDKEDIISSNTTAKSVDVTTKNTQPKSERPLSINEAPFMSDWLNEDHGDDDDDDAEDSENEAEQKQTIFNTQDSKDSNEYIFPTASIIHEVKSVYDQGSQSTTTPTPPVVASPHSAAKNKTKCKKKKHNNLAIEDSSQSTSVKDSENVTAPTTTTTPDILNDLFGGFTMDDVTENTEQEHTTRAPEQNQSQSEKHESFAKLDDLEEFLHSLESKNNHQNEEEYVDEDDEDSPFNNTEENSGSRHNNEDYYEEDQESRDRPFSLLELISME